MYPVDAERAPVGAAARLTACIARWRRRGVLGETDPETACGRHPRILRPNEFEIE